MVHLSASRRLSTRTAGELPPSRMRQPDSNDVEQVPRRADRVGVGVDLGHEPPLDMDGGGPADVDRLSVNLRWLAASVLIGLTGAFLIGAAIYVSVEGDTNFAELPERAAAPGPKTGAEERATNTARKGDKLVRADTIASAKQSFRAPVTIRAGDREVIKVRPFVRIATGLSVTTGVYATDIPAFNPLRFFAAENGERLPETAPADVADADVSVVKKDLTAMTIDGAAPALSDQDVLAQVAEERRLSAQAGRRPVVAVPGQLMLSRTLRQPPSLPEAFGGTPGPETAFSSIEVRVVPENVTTWSKTDTRGADPLVDERDLTLQKGETLETTLRANGATNDQLRSMMNALSGRAKTGLNEGQRIRLLVAPAGPGLGRQIMRIVLFGENGIEEIVAANDRGVFVSVTPPRDETRPRQGPARKAQAGSEQEDEEEEDEGSGARLYDSLYETILKNELPRQTVEDLVRIFGYDVDFQRRVSGGDNLELFYSVDEESAGERMDILYASLNVGGEVRRVYRFQGDDGSVDYLDDQGRSLKKFLIRKPIAEGVLRSGFGYRRHPILGYAKMHTGVDWANKIGTPIIAAGNGTVIKAEWDSGYGRRVELQHANGYVTAYNHMSRFGRGVAPGARMRQGQVIGYVGSTGLSTGPHLHYEVIVNGHFVDPMKIRVPRGRELDGRALAEFKRQREQVDDLLKKAGGSTRLAQGSAGRT
jgi:murein DD-endopeptidase MepM/ murein hydrolase activator NlpD